MKKMINNEVIEMTAEEISQRETDIANANAEATAKATADAQEKADAKAGNDKLIELGLTQDQVTAMTGYTPPSE